MHAVVCGEQARTRQTARMAVAAMPGQGVWVCVCLLLQQLAVTTLPLRDLLPSLWLPGWVLVPGLPCDGLVCDFGVMSLSFAQMALGLGEPVATVVQGLHLARPFASSKPWTLTFWLAPVVSQVCVCARMSRL
jgi:hypothetical protein